MGKDISTLTTAYQTIKDELIKLRQAQKVLDDEEAALNARKQLLHKLPIPIDDVKTLINAYIDNSGKGFLKDPEWTKQIRLFLYPNRYDDVHPKKNLPINYLEATSIIKDGLTNENINIFGEVPKIFLPYHDNFIATNKAAMFFFGDAIKAKIAEQFDSLGLEHEGKDKQEVGAPIADRAIEIESIDNRLQAIIVERGDLAGQVKKLTNLTNL